MTGAEEAGDGDDPATGTGAGDDSLGATERPSLLARLRGAAARSRTLVDLAWRTGEFVHRRAADAAPGPRPRSDRAAGVHGGDAAPTYPYGPPETDPVDPVPAAGVDNPVLTAADVTDFGTTHFVADPFLFVTPGGDYHMFFEVYSQHREPTAAIAHATSEDGADWTYDRVVLETDVHLSFPYVFRWDGDHYMVPDKWSKDPSDPSPVTLYRASDFPYGWERVVDVVDLDRPFHDCVPFRWQDRWWAILGNGRDLRAYYSDDLTAPDWMPHAGNPVVRGRPQAARPGGRPIVRDDYVLLFLQEGVTGYGDRVRGYEVTELTPETYVDAECDDSPVVEPTDGSLGWRSGYMHQFDPWYDGEGWWCAVDGEIGAGQAVLGPAHWAIGVFEVREE